MIVADELIARVAARTGMADLDAIRRALEATLAELAAALSTAEAETVAADLPPSLAARVREAHRAAGPWKEDPYDDLAARASLPRAVAVEHAHVICQLLADELGPDSQVLLARNLGSPWRELFHWREETESPPPPHHAPRPGEGHTLASGRPGSRHPVAESGADRAQRESIARSDNPHGHEKLSSGETNAEPIATAHPDPRRRISDADG